MLNSYLENGDVSKRNVLHDEDGSVSSDNNRFASLLQKIVKGEIALDSNEGSELSILADKIIRLQKTEYSLFLMLGKEMVFLKLPRTSRTSILLSLTIHLT